MAPLPILRSRDGQHLFEYALLIGMVTIAALAMQLFARRGVQTGLQMVSDAVLGEPPAPDPTAESSVNVTATSAVTEAGDAAFRRFTTVAETVQGDSVNEDTRLQVLRE